jgi:hypothetical protein
MLNKIRFPFSLVILFIANLFPIIGVFLFDWNVFTILFIYWIENIAVGFSNFVKMIYAKGKIEKFFLIPFFVIHYTAFTIGHGLFLFFIFIKDATSLLNFDIFLGLSIIAIFLSHGISFFRNFIYNKEYKKISTSSLFFHPYKRVLIMHIVIISGAFVITSVQSPKILIFLLVLLKILIDGFSHIREHKIIKPSRKNNYL